MLELCIACERLAAGGYPGGEADHLDGDGGDDDRAPRNAGAAGALAARDRLRPQPVLLRLHRARGGLEREQPAHHRHADRRRVLRSRGAKTYISALESSETMIVVARDAGERRPHAPRPPDPVRERHRDAGARRRAGVRAPVERVLRRRRRVGRRRPRRARQGRPRALRRAQPRAPRRRLAGGRRRALVARARPRPMPASGSSSTSRSGRIRPSSTRSPSR